jgi:hypothetical protein
VRPGQWPAVPDGLTNTETTHAAVPDVVTTETSHDHQEQARLLPGEHATPLGRPVEPVAAALPAGPGNGPLRVPGRRGPAGRRPRDPPAHVAAACPAHRQHLTRAPPRSRPLGVRGDHLEYAVTTLAPVMSWFGRQAVVISYAKRSFRTPSGRLVRQVAPPAPPPPAPDVSSPCAPARSTRPSPPPAPSRKAPSGSSDTAPGPRGEPDGRGCALRRRSRRQAAPGSQHASNHLRRPWPSGLGTSAPRPAQIVATRRICSWVSGPECATTTPWHGRCQRPDLSRQRSVSRTPSRHVSKSSSVIDCARSAVMETPSANGAVRR